MVRAKGGSGRPRNAHTNRVVSVVDGRKAARGTVYVNGENGPIDKTTIDSV